MFFFLTSSGQIWSDGIFYSLDFLVENFPFET